MKTNDGHITLKTFVDTSGITNGMNTVKSIVGKTAKSLLVISAAVAAGAAVITKKAVEAYAEYEQLVGGVETLFKESSEKLIKYADMAFMTAGLSANEYMSMVTSFSASLIGSLSGDTEKAADIANMALIDMSDNANKMGTEMELIQNAYQGFSKQNYTMLDNLKLGYGGTKTEMERLLADAQKITGIKYDISNLADVYNAIHVIQQKLKITGTTAEEAEKTISGSAAMTKAAWKNTLTAIAGGGDIDGAINNLVYSIGKYFENIVPVVERSLKGIGQLIEKIAPQLVQTVARSLIKAIPSLLKAVYEMIIGLAKGIWQGINDLFSGGAVKTVQAQTEAIDSAVNSQNALTDAVEATSKAQDKVLAGFDQLNILQESSTSDSSGDSTASVLQTVGGTGFSTVAKAAVGEVKKEVSGLVEAWEDFYYKMTGEMSVAAALNYNNALLKFKNSSKDFISSLTGDNDIDSVELASDAANFSLKNSTGAFTVLSGIMDIGAGFNSLDFETAYKGLGRLLGGGGMLNAQIGSLLGMGEDLSELYFPLSEEIPNLYKELTAYQAKALQNHNQLYSALKVELKDFTWGDTVIDDAAFNSLSASVEALFTNAAEQAENSKDEIISNLNAMVEKGYLSDGEAKTALKNADETAHKQRTALKTNQKKVMEILKAASGERRSLTTSEREQVERLLSESNTTIIKSINTNNQRRIELESELNDAKTEIDKVRLSQVIQFANSEYEETVAVANKKYDDTIAEANRLYYDLGVINEAQYNDIVKKARETKNAEIKEAQESKTKLVKLAKEKAGEVADTVDPESGEILSNWELLWNRAYTKVKNVINDIIDTINSAIKGVNGVLGNSAPAALLKLAGVENLPKIPQIPRLARGAVIPANREFLAVLGDQKNGRNLEAPEELIRKIVREETGGQQLTVKATGSMAQLIRLLRLEIQKEDTRSSIY